MHHLLMFIAGTFLCNCLPHLLSGLRGDAFPSPFAKPPGRGNSRPVVNFLWGTANMLIGGALVAYSLPKLAQGEGVLALLIGWLACGLMLANHFGKVRQG
jgi:hypothetical protein